MDPEKKEELLQKRNQNTVKIKVNMWIHSNTFKKKIKEGPYYISWHLLMM